MARALALAARPGGRPSPNPNVGAVALDEESGAILAEGYHRSAGLAHAERALLDDAHARGVDLRGSTLVCTLEPCSHLGRTPPCAPLVADAGFARAVIALRDPNPLVGGRGIGLLRERGIEVVENVAEQQARRLLEGYLHWVRTGRPFVHLKMAMLPDGTVHRGAGLSAEISGAQARRLVHWWRHLSPAVMVGAGTVRRDDPRLTVRELPPGLEADPWQPRRVVLASTFEVAPRGRGFSLGPDGPPPLVIGSEEAPPGAESGLERAGVATARVRSSGDRADPTAALDLLGNAGVTGLLVEGGPTLADALLAAGLVNRLSVFVAEEAAEEEAAPEPPGPPSVERPGRVIWSPPGGIPFRGRGLLDVQRLEIGTDLLITGLTGITSRAAALDDPAASISGERRHGKPEGNTLPRGRDATTARSPDAPPAS
jgi:diaminohydroxyphosphoribosylaminopyrimidine deaminase/5-amino-6-(5-phosphoribosylamino)uracil reductase